MALIEIPYGSKASSETHNSNNRFLLSEIQTLAAVVDSSTSSITENVRAELANYESLVYPIGSPKISLSNTLKSNEIWLEGAEVLKEDYPNLYSIYGDTYGTASDNSKFILPDFRNRALWGDSSFGYIQAGLPNLTGTTLILKPQGSGLSGAFSLAGAANYGLGDGGIIFEGRSLSFNASQSNAIYGNSSTVQPPSIKIRVKTRFE